MLTSDDIQYGFRFILGRAATPEEIASISGSNWNLMQLREQLINSDEFAVNEKVIGHFSKWVITEILDERIKIWIDLADKFVGFGCLINNYEPWETAAFRQLLKPGDHVVDAGANVGWFTFVAATIVGPSGKVFAFEPGEPVKHYLRRSIALNGLQDLITLFDHALGDRNDEVSIVWHPASRNMGSMHLGTPTSDTAQSRALMRKLDDVLNGERIDSIKMDIEGAEGLVCRGADRILSCYHPSIISEINPNMLKMISGLSVDEYLNFFMERSYRCLMIVDDNKQIECCNASDFGSREMLNVLFIHKTKSGIIPA